MTELLSFLLVCAVSALLSCLALRALRPNWSRWRTTFLSALPVPMIVLAICAYVFIAAAMTSKEACGVDACGMAMMFAMIGAAAAVGGFVTGFILCALLFQVRAP